MTPAETPPPTPAASGPSDPTCHVFVPVDGTDLPPLDALPGVRRVADEAPGENRTTWFDTAGLALTRSGVALQHVVAEDGSSGWLLDLPIGGARERLQATGGGGRPPKRLRDAVTAWVLAEELAAVATARETTTSHPLLDGAGVELAVVTEHRLQADLLDPGAQAPAWREWSVRLRNADVALLEAVDLALADAGAERVGRRPEAPALLLAARGAAPVVHGGKARPGRPAGRVLGRRLEQQLRALREHDSEVRRSGVAGVHGLRVALRRSRAALGSYGALLERAATAPLREELGWAARALGASRDGQVTEEVLLALVAAESSSDVVGPVRRRVRSHFGSTRRSARAEVAAVLDSPRYLALVAAFDRLVADPPWTELAQRPARDALPPLALRDWKRLRDRVRAARAATGPDSDELLHEARKAAKRLRYAAETLEPVSGRVAHRLARRAAALQSVLGEHQDAVVTRSRLRQLVDAAAAAGEPTFSYGRLDRVLQEWAEAGRAAWETTARKVARPRL